ncbi:DUF4843 domain-containing protein [Niastella sp. OAS944]|uniref:DUF4843 domain-containing protein n=1 Tax=Niastella sp. OAS944 TaxID=2664089 RepID=UPI0034855940|nr:hypothetical protein [Chitinophagaceae bacterium OAS944]
MKNIIVVLAAVMLTTACKKEQIPVFTNPDNHIYFNLAPYGFQDSMVYTFAYHPERAKDTIWVPVRISGNRPDSTLTYSAKIVDASSTAVVNKHYEPLKDTYTFPAHAGTSRMPVILYSVDTMLLLRSYAVTIQLLPSANLGTAYADQDTVRVVFSNRLEKPAWWDDCPKGPYSIVKHQLFRLSATTEDVSRNPFDVPIRLYYSDRFNALLLSPETWIANNPDKGYEIKVRPDGNKEFFYSATPEKKYLYRKNPQSGKFFFIDENGNEVI